MNYHVAEQIARDRLREARQMAAQANLIKDLPEIPSRYG